MLGKIKTWVLAHKIWWVRLGYACFYFVVLELGFFYSTHDIDFKLMPINFLVAFGVAVLVSATLERFRKK